MLPQFDIPTFAKHALPPNYRLPKWVAAAQAALYGLAWRYGIFQAYQGGDTQLPWNPATTYNTGDKVLSNFATWESLANGNTGNNPIVAPLLWTPRCASFIGANERAAYNGRYLTLTWALNRYFGTTFRQPPYPTPYGSGTAFSDIYITNVAPSFTSFVSFATEPRTSEVYALSTGNNEVFTTGSFAGGSSYQFTIYMPAAVYSALGATAAISRSVVRAFADKYVPCGISYTIATY